MVERKNTSVYELGAGQLACACHFYDRFNALVFMHGACVMASWILGKCAVQYEI